MAVTQARTREEIRVDIGNQLGQRFFKSSDASGSGSGTTLVDNKLRGGDDTYNGWWIVFTSGLNDGRIRRVSDYTGSSGTITWVEAADSTAANDTYELWHENFPPDSIHSHINTGIQDVTRRFYDPVENTSLHSDGRTSRYDIPSGVDVIYSLLYRAKSDSALVHSGAETFDQKTDSDLTQSVDSEFYKEGASSLKCVVAAGLGDDDYIADSITSVDLSRMTHLEFWIYSTVALTAGDLIIHLNNDTMASSLNTPEESLDVPAVTARTWTFCRVALASPDTDTAIISVALEMEEDKGAFTFYLDGLRATNQERDKWRVWPRKLWRTEKESADLIIKQVSHMGSAWIKLLGGKKPALLTADASTSEVPSSLLVTKALSLAYYANAEPDLGSRWDQRFRAEKRNLPTIVGARQTA